jgi:hypothetical protein
VLLAVDAHHHLVEVPVVARPRPQAPQVAAMVGPNFRNQRRAVS